MVRLFGYPLIEYLTQDGDIIAFYLFSFVAISQRMILANTAQLRRYVKPPQLNEKSRRS